MVLEPPRSFRLIRPAALIGGLLALGVLLSACGASGFEYVSSSDRKAYFKVPAGWKYFDKRDILVASGQSLSAETNRQLPWLIAYDSDPGKPSLDHVLSLAEAPVYPVIMARVEALPFQIRDRVSLGGLRNWVYPVDRLVDANAAEVLSYQDVVLDGGIHGNAILYDVQPAGISNVALGNEVIRVYQVAVVDPNTQNLYLFMIRCESHCYRSNKSLLDQIAQSWTVKEK